MNKSITINEGKTGDICYLSNTWTDETREAHPSKDIIGYNTEKKRCEFYIKITDKWYYEWNDLINLDIPGSLPSLFSDNFIEDWFEDNIYTELFTEDFNSQWREDNIFTKIMQDNFQTGWFENNVFSNIFQEQFEDVSWE